MQVVFTTHCHQPPGNLDWVIDRNADLAYLPLIEVLAEHPAMRVTLHYSGSLLQWCLENRRDLIDRLIAVGDQAEWMGGGFHEPILATLPDAWRRRQVTMQHELISETFDRSPTGLWLAERVWEPTLAWVINDMGYEYTMLDEDLFTVAGHPPTSPVTVEHLGRPLTVLPIDRELRHHVPGDPVEVVMGRLGQIAAEQPDGVVVLADDGEKFGAWGGSHDELYTHGWLDRFFGALTSTDGIEVVTASEALAGRDAPPAALAAGSYSQMNIWTVAEGTQADRSEVVDPVAVPHLWPGRWQTFLTRYPEANTMYRKMLTLAGDDRLSEEGRNALAAAQANDAYWHGTFGGVYLPHLRAEVHANLIAARRTIDRGRRGRSWSELTIRDWDADGRDEMHVELQDQSWVLDDHGHLRYFDDKPSGWSVSDVMSRHREPVHDADHDGDDIVRRWLVDRWAPEETSVTTLFTPPLRRRFELEHAEASRGTAEIVISSEHRDGTITKRLRATDRRLDVHYTLDGMPHGRFGPELPVSVWAGVGTFRTDGGAWVSADERHEVSGHRFRFRHEARDVELVIDLRMPGGMFVAPLRTTSQSESQQESITQGVLLWPHFLTSGAGEYQLSIEIMERPS